MRILLVEDDKKLAGYLKKGFIEGQYAVDVYHGRHVCAETFDSR
jgi:DNA-binding response OmpR family regulator